MSDETMDGSIASAISSMPDIEALEVERGVALPQPTQRAPDGRFEARKADGVKEIEPKDAAAPVDAAKEAKEAKEAQPAEEDDEDYIELPPEEEGKEAQRLKLSEVLDGYKSAATLKAELEEARKVPAAPMPAQYEQELVQTVQARQELMQALQQLHAATNPVPPDINMVLSDPEGYYRQVQAFEAAHRERAALREAYGNAQKQQDEQSQILAKARFDREWARTLEFWPELKDKAQASRIVDDVSKAYGFSAQEVAAIQDSRALAVIKDALAYRAGKAAQETAVKVVKAKPKLVKAQARSTQNGKQAQFAAASQRLASSHSIEDAADALGALLN